MLPISNECKDSITTIQFIYNHWNQELHRKKLPILKNENML